MLSTATKYAAAATSVRHAAAIDLTPDELRAAGLAIATYGAESVRAMRINGKIVDSGDFGRALAAYEASQAVDSGAATRAFDGAVKIAARVSDAVEHVVEVVLEPIRGPALEAWQKCKDYVSEHMPEAGDGAVGRAVEWTGEQMQRAGKLMTGNPERVAIAGEADLVLTSGERVSYCPVGVDRNASAKNERLSLLAHGIILGPAGLIGAALVAPISGTAAAVLVAFPVVQTAIAGGQAVYARAASHLAERRGDAAQAAARQEMAAKYATLAGTAWLGFGPLTVGGGLSAVGAHRDMADLDALVTNEAPKA